MQEATRNPQTGLPQAGEGARRDERLDLLRGFAVVAMVVDHVAGSSVLYAFTGGNRFYTSAAEAFIFISGLVMGLVYRRLIHRNGLGASLERAVQRSVTLYLLAVTLTLFFVPLSELLRLKWAQGIAFNDPSTFIVSVLTLHQTYYLVDIPLLYALLLAAAPLALAMLAQGRWAVVLAASWLLWGLYQFFPAQAAFPWPIEGNHLFFFAPWQVFFFTGLVLGWYHSELSERLAAIPRRAALAASSVGFAALAALYLIVEKLAPDVQLVLLEAVFSKADVRPGRIVASVVVFAFFYLLVAEAWRPLSRRLGWLLIPLGQNALYAYAAHVALVIPLQWLADALAAQGIAVEASNLGVQAGALAGIWLLIKGRVLFVNGGSGAARYAWPTGAAVACMLVIGSMTLPPPATVGAEPDPNVAEPVGATLAPNAARFARVFGTPVPVSPRTAHAGPNNARPDRPAVLPGASGSQPPSDNLSPSASKDGSAGAQAASEYVGPLLGSLAAATFFSPSLGREMPYFVYLPPEYHSGSERYPVLFMLHGYSGSNEEWLAYGLVDRADAMIVRGEIRPLIIVLPQGDYSYWVNLVDGPAYGDYLSTDLVDHSERTYRVLPGAGHRAVGGLSMGGSGALINAFVNPSVFGIVGAHSPSLPEEGWREFLGSGDDFARRDPISLAFSEAWLNDLTIWIDMGDEDFWLSRGEALRAALVESGLTHEWRVFPGDHCGDYWEEHIPDYLRFYDSALAPSVS